MILSINTSTSRGKVAFRRVKNCKSGDYPEGNAKLAWDRLMSSYAPKSLPSLLKFKRKFENSKLESAEIDPEEWISEMEGLTIEIESIDAMSAISERELMVKILNNLPSEYDVVLDGLETRLNNASGTDGLTLEDVREKLSTRYDRIKANKEDELKSSEEKAFTAFKFKKQYKGLCGYCGKYGHKSTDCPENFRGKFWYCHKKGHKIIECEKLKKDMARKETEKK